MADNVYDIVGAFQSIEEDLITSMSRNMKRHIGEEFQENINWTQWQAEMLNGLAQFKYENTDKLKGYYSTINDDIEEMIRKAYATGESEQEIEILKAIRDGYKADVTGKGTNAVQGAFFKVNDNKLNALIQATANDFQKAEHSILRRTEDIYRQTIFTAQMHYNTGAKSLWQAVDMATKDFLSAGINSIEYKNGTRVNVASYSEMALRTANKRANLMGAGNKRNEYGITTVKVTEHASACPFCIQWQGQVYYDDVYSGYDPSQLTEKKYKRLSEAIAGNLFHPQCKNGLSSYYEGISKPPHKTTKAEAEEMTRRYNLEQRQRECERNIRKYERLKAGSLDADNVARYSQKSTQWKNEYNRLIASNPDVLRKEPERLKLYGIGTIEKGIRKVPTIKAPTKAEPKTIKGVWNDYSHTYTSYANKKEMKNYLKSQYGIDFSDSKKYPMDKELMEDCINWLDKFNGCYPEFAKKNDLSIPVIKVAAPSSMKSSVGYYRYYTASHEPVELALNAGYHGNVDKFRQYVDKCIGDKWYPANATIHKTFVHEYGHHVSNSLCNIYGRDFEGKFINECIEEFKKVNPNYTYNTYVGLGDYLSRYGSTKQCECFAEAFAEYFGGENPRTFAKIFGEKLETILKGVK